MADFENLYLNNQLCFALYSATHAVTRSYREHLSELGLTYPQYLVMLVLWQHQNQHVKELADKLDLDSSTLTPILKRLENAKLITRTRDNNNERTVVISLTTLGSEIQAQTSRIQQQVSCETGLTELEYIDLKEKLAHMLNNFKTKLQRQDAWLAKLPSDL
jgi:MarR family transcriptional regulator, organic hydroperoxide resistance regulator